MTDDITELRAALAAATPGQWDYSKDGNGGGMITVHLTPSGIADYLHACRPDRIARVANRLEAAERDAARYRWLRDSMAYQVLTNFQPPYDMPYPSLPFGADNWPAGMDAAIDAAMHTEGEK